MTCCVGLTNNSSFIFSVPEGITATVENGIATFGTAAKLIPFSTLLKKTLCRWFFRSKICIDNSFIDTQTIVVKVAGASDTGEGREYRLVDNILSIDETSEIPNSRSSG